MKWTTTREIYLQSCVCAYINLDFHHCIVSVDETAIIDGRSILISGRLHLDTLNAFRNKIMSLLNAHLPWEWVESKLKPEIEAAEINHRYLRSWVKTLYRPLSTGKRKLSFYGRLLTCPELTSLDLHEAFSVADRFYVKNGISTGLRSYPGWQSDLRQMLEERAKELCCESQTLSMSPKVHYEQIHG